MTEWKEHNEGQRRYFEERPLPRMVPERSPYLVRQVEELVRFARLVPGERVLKIGAGMGRYTLLLAGKGLALEGMDLSPVLLERLRKYDGGNTRCRSTRSTWPSPRRSSRDDSTRSSAFSHFTTCTIFAPASAEWRLCYPPAGGWRS